MADRARSPFGTLILALAHILGAGVAAAAATWVTIVCLDSAQRPGAEEEESSPDLFYALVSVPAGPQSAKSQQSADIDPS